MDIINKTLKEKTYLLHIITNTYNIPERLKEYDKSLFVVFNEMKGKYEIHSTANKWGGTYCLTVPFEQLDARTLELIRRSDMAVRGKQWIIDYEESNNKAEKDKEKKKKEMMREVAENMHSTFKRVANEMGY